MAQTIVEKVLSRAAGKDGLRSVEIAVCRPDMVVKVDLTLNIEGLWYRPKELFDRDCAASIFNHAVPAPSIQDAAGMAEGRNFAREFGLKHSL